MYEFMYTGLVAMLIIVVVRACERGGVLTLYLLSLAGIGVCESVCTEPVVVEHVMLGGSGGEVWFGQVLAQNL